MQLKTWSKIKNKLEQEYLAESLRGHIQYFVTTYRKSHDQEGRAAILLDGKELISGGYYKRYSVAHLFPKDEKYETRMREEISFMDDTALQLGVFDQRSFYQAFYEFDNQSIEKSLKSENLLVQIFAILDKRVGKRRLLLMKKEILDEPKMFQLFYTIRIEKEGIDFVSRPSK